MSASKLVPVRLLGNYRNLNSGEVAGFPPAEVELMIADGVAEPYQAGDTDASDDSGDDSKAKGRGKKAKPDAE